MRLDKIDVGARPFHNGYRADFLSLTVRLSGYDGYPPVKQFIAGTPEDLRTYLDEVLSDCSHSHEENYLYIAEFNRQMEFLKRTEKLVCSGK